MTRMHVIHSGMSAGARSFADIDRRVGPGPETSHPIFELRPSRGAK